MGHRILFFGNTGNVGFRFSTWLRKKGYDVNLFYPKDFKHERSLPEWANPLLKDCYPDWIRFSKKSRFPFYLPSLALKKESNSFDVILTTGEFVIPALCLKNPSFSYQLVEISLNCHFFSITLKMQSDLFFIKEESSP